MLYIIFIEEPIQLIATFHIQKPRHRNRQFVLWGMEKKIQYRAMTLTLT